MASGDSSGFIPSIPDSLPENFDPQEAGILTAILNIVRSGAGAMMTATLIGIAALPAGTVLGFQKLFGGLRTFLFEFFQAFFAPFEIATTCLITRGGRCSADLGFEQTGLFVQSAGILGFAAAALAVGAILYVFSQGVSRWRA